MAQGKRKQYNSSNKFDLTKESPLHMVYNFCQCYHLKIIEEGTTKSKQALYQQ